MSGLTFVLNEGIQQRILSLTFLYQKKEKWHNQKGRATIITFKTCENITLSNFSKMISLLYFGMVCQVTVVCSLLCLVSVLK